MQHYKLSKVMGSQVPRAAFRNKCHSISHSPRDFAFWCPGHNLPGAVGGSAIEVLALALLVAGLTTEVLKFAGGMQGGETGTGGRF